jgi:hypothetical protein
MYRKAVQAHTFAAISFLFAAMFLGAAAVAQETGTLNGTLLDDQGAAVPNSLIELRWNYLDNRMHWNGATLPKPKQPRKRLLRAHTDRAGNFSLQLLAGNWDVVAYRDGFAPACAIALIQANETSTVELRFPQRSAIPIQ